MSRSGPRSISPSQTLDPSGEFWRSEFKNLSATLFPPLSSICQERDGKATQTIDLDYVECESLSIEAALVVAWALVLSSYTGNDDVVFGLSVDLIDRVGPENACLPFRLQISPRATIADTLHATEARLANWATHAGSTGDLGRLGGEVTMARNFRNALHIRRGQCDTTLDLSKRSVPLMVNCYVRPEGIRVDMVQGASTAVEIPAQMMLFQLAHNLQGVLQAHPNEALIGGLRAACSQSWDRLIGISGCPPPPALEECVHDRIVAWCQTQPSAPAVAAWDGHLTYSELDQLSSGLAGRFATVQQLHPDQVVCVLMEKSVWVSVSILAILKAGAAFLLLDPLLPQERMKNICQMTQAPLLLSSVRYLSLAKLLGPPILEVSSRTLADGNGKNNRPLFVKVQPQNLCNCLLTSGSTGEPKVAAIEHAAVRTAWESPSSDRIGLGPTSRVFQFASHAFGVSIIDYLGTFLSGGCLCVPSEEQLQNDIAGGIRALKATFIAITPSAARLLDPTLLPSLETVALAGEPLSTLDLRLWQRHVTLFSMYGQSEIAAYSLLSLKDGPTSRPREIGIPLHSWRGWIVDCDNHDWLVPFGGVGELLLEGPSLGRGYLNDDARTEEKYISPPAWLQQLRCDEPSRSYRVLKTGDVVRYAPSGEIEFLRRKNSAEVKLRGQRMDLIEIESELQKHYPTAPRVSTDIIVPCDDVSDHSALLVGFVLMEPPHEGTPPHCTEMFVTPTSETRKKATEAIRHLKEVLPEYMVPSVIVTVNSMPLTPSGKLHRQRLRHLASGLTRRTLLAYRNSMPVVTQRYAVTNEERIIHQACAEALCVNPATLGMDDVFSELGGDSLAARRMVYICRRNGLPLTVADIFGHGSLATLASSCDKALREIGPSETTRDSLAPLKEKFLRALPAEITATEVEDVLPLQGAQRREADEINYFIFSLHGNVDVGRLQSACEALVQMHPPLRSMLVPLGSDLVNVVLRSYDSHFFHRRLGIGADLGEWAESYRRSDLPTSGKPVTQFILAQAGVESDRSVFIMRLSHAQYDGDCISEIVSRLWAQYDNRPVVPKSSFGDFVREAHRRLQRPECSAYWRDLLAGTELTPLPIAPLSEGEEARAFVTRQYVEVRKKPDRGITMATVVKAAWAELIRRRTGTSTVVLSQVLNGRDMVASNGDDILVGACHSIVPLVVRFPPASFSVNQPTMSVLSYLQAQYVSSLQYGIIDWDRLVEHYTQWPAKSKVGFMLQYCDFPQLTHFHVGDLLVRCVAQFTGTLQPGEAWVSVTPTQTGLEVAFSVFNNVLTEEEASSWLDDYKGIIGQFLSG